MAYKVFTNGSVLNASEINDNLMKQVVSVFSNAAARTAAITSPVEGQLTYLEDTDRLQYWNGSSWRSPDGLTLLNTTTFTAQTSVDITNVFSAEYDNYRIVVNATLGTNTAARLQLRLLSGTTPVTTGYSSNQISYNLGTAGVQQSATGDGTNMMLGWVPVATNSGKVIITDISDPFKSSGTGFFGTFVGDASNAYASWGLAAGYLGNSTSYDGIRLFPGTSNITGTARVYGYRNA